LEDSGGRQVWQHLVNTPTATRASAQQQQEEEEEAGAAERQGWQLKGWLTNTMYR